MKKNFNFGSTGSIGESTLKIIKRDKKNFEINLLSTNKNVKKILNKQKKLRKKYNYYRLKIFQKSTN